MLSLNQRLSQQQKLSPQQIQYQKLLQLNTLALEQRIKTELELNPILEEEMELSQDQDENERERDDDVDPEVKDADKEEFELEDFMNDDEMDHEKVYRGSEEDVFQPIAPQRESLSEYLLDQLRMLNLEENLSILGEEIIGSLDVDGRLRGHLYYGRKV